MRDQLFEQFLIITPFALSEDSIYERLRRHPAIEFDPYLAHAALIYYAASALVLEQVHREYLDVGQQHNLTMFALTDTWRGNQERIGQSKFRRYKVNQDNVQFLATIRDSYGTPGESYGGEFCKMRNGRLIEWKAYS